jgi:uracil-DNA glycosylase
VPWSRHAGDGQALTGARIVAAVRCAPPANTPTPAERATCGRWLDRDLELAAPTVRVLLALGAIAWDAALASARRVGALHERPRPRFGHGAAAELAVPDRLQAAGARPTWTLLGSYHVSQQNTFTGKLTEAMLDAVLEQARTLAGYRL